MRRRLLDHTYKKTVTGNPAIAKSVARMYPDISFPGFTTQDGTPSPESPVDIVNAQSPVQVEVMGAQLFDYRNIENIDKNGGKITNNNNNSFLVNGSFTAQTFTTPVLLDIPSGNYYVSDNIKRNDLIFYVGYRTKGSTDVWRDYNNRMITIPENSEVRAYINVVKGSNINNEIIYPMLNKGETPLPYEKYKQPQTVILNPPRPLSKIDTLEKVNGIWNWVYRMSDKTVFDGSENWKLHNGGFYIQLGLPNTTSINTKKQIGFSNMFPFSRSGELLRFNITSSADQASPMIFNTGIEDVEEWKTFLGKNKPEFIYQIIPEFIPLSQEEQEQINALHTNNPTTIVQNSIGTDVTLTYKTKRSLEVTQ